MSEEVGIGVAITGDPSGGVAALKTVENAGESYEATILRIAQNVTVGLDSVVRKLDDLGKAHKEAAEKAREGMDGLTSGVISFGHKFEEAFSSKALLGEMATNILGIVGPLAILEAGAEAVKEVFSAIVDFTKEATLYADTFRDLGLTLSIIEGGAQKGSEVYQYFEQRLDHTRDTAHKLGDELIRLEPLLSARHFSTTQQEETVMQLSQLATMKPQMGDIDSLISGLQRVMMGSASGSSTAGGGRNPLLKALGITPDQMTGDLDDTVQLVRTKLAEMTSHFDEFGDSVKSTMEKSKEALLVDFAEGFNEARGNVVYGMDAIKAAVADPDIKETFTALGTAVATIFGGVGQVIRGVAEEIKDTKAAIDAITIEIRASSFGSVLDGIAIAWDHLPAPLKALIKLDAMATAEGLTNIPIVEISDLAASGRAAQLAQANSPEAQLKTAMGFIDFANTKPPTRIKTGAPGKDDGADDTTAADTKAMNEQRASLAEILRNKKEELSSNDRLLASQLAATKAQADQVEKVALLAATSKLETEEIKNQHDQSVQLATLTEQEAVAKNKLLGDQLTGAEQLRSAELKLQDDRDKGDAIGAAAGVADIAAIKAKTAVVVANDQIEIDGLAKRITGLDAYGQKLQEAAQGKAWEAMNAAEEKALNRADDSMDRFIEKTKDKLAEMPSSIGDALSKKLADIKTAMDTAMAFTSSILLGGFNPEMARQIQAFYMQQAVDAEASASRISKMQTEELIKGEKLFSQQFGSDFASLIESGGHNFIAILDSGFKQTVAEAAKNLAAYLTGTPGDKTKIDAATGGPQQAGQMYDPHGNNITGQSRAIQGVQAGAQIAAAGYQAGFSGVPGSRTGAELGGAVAGASLGAEFGTALAPGIGTAIGAVAGFAIAAIAGAIGAQQRQADYKYGDPTVVGGVAHFTNTQNYTYEALQAVTRQIQQIYDSVHDSLVMVLVKAGALVPAMQDINGKFQDNPSGHYEEHLQQYLAGGLQSATINQFKTDLTSLAENFGVSSDRFAEIWTNLQNLDPQKVVTLIASLMDSLQGLSASLPGQQPNMYDVQHWTDAMVGFNPFAQIYGNVEHQAQLNPGQQVAQQDKSILDLASAWKSLSPEGQINALAQVNTLVQQRYQTEIQLAQQLYALVQQIDASSQSATKNYQAQQILKDDGSVDQYGLSQFYKKQADADLREASLAKNANQLAAAWQKYQADVQSAEQAGYGQDPTAAGKKAWAQWGIDNTAAGKAIFDQLAIAIGGSINLEQAAFNKQFDPIIEAFKTAVQKMFDPSIDPSTGLPWGSNGNGDGSDKKPGENPIIKANATLVANTNALSSAMTAPVTPATTLAAVFDSLAASAAALDDMLNSISFGGGQSTDGTSAFVARRQASQR